MMKKIRIMHGSVLQSILCGKKNFATLGKINCFSGVPGVPISAISINHFSVGQVIALPSCCYATDIVVFVNQVLPWDRYAHTNTKCL